MWQNRPRNNRYHRLHLGISTCKVTRYMQTATRQHSEHREVFLLGGLLWWMVLMLVILNKFNLSRYTCNGIYLPHNDNMNSHKCVLRVICCRTDACLMYLQLSSAFARIILIWTCCNLFSPPYIYIFFYYALLSRSDPFADTGWNHFFKPRQMSAAPVYLQRVNGLYWHIWQILCWTQWGGGPVWFRVMTMYDLWNESENIMDNIHWLIINGSETIRPSECFSVWLHSGSVALWRVVFYHHRDFTCGPRVLQDTAALWYL